MISRTVKISISAVGLSAALAGAALSSGASPAGAAAGQPQAAALSARAAALTAAPAITDQAPLSGAVVWSAVSAQAPLIPLPEGGSFTGINWNATFTPHEIARQLQANAACQWWRAVVAGTPGAVEVAQTIPSWPAFRGDDPIAAQSAAATPLLDNPAELEDAIQWCYGLQATLVRQASEQGQVASR